MATMSEQEVYDERISENAIEEEKVDYVNSSCRKRHEGCMMTRDGPFKIPSEEHKFLTMDLQVLGACRQLYEECNHLLWATNTFSFDDATSLNKFLGSLNLAQKRNLSNIHISAHNNRFYPTHSTTEEWKKALKLSYINVLSGIQNLHLCLQTDFGTFLQYYPHDRSYEALKENLDGYLKPFLRLRAVNAKNITILLCDDLDKYPNLDMASTWNRSISNEYAENLRAQLAASDGVELVKADAEKANAEREITIMKNAKRDATVFDFRLKNVRCSVQRFTAFAEECDRRADKYEAKAAKASGDNKKARSRNSTKLQKWADRNRASAKIHRDKVEVLELNSTAFENRSIEAIAKYKRAKARVQARRVKNGEDPCEDISASSDEELQARIQDEQDEQERIDDAKDDSDDPLSLSKGTNREVDDEDEGASENEEAQLSEGQWNEFLSFPASEIDEDAKATDADDELDEDYAS